eukprot:480428_1
MGISKVAHRKLILHQIKHDKKELKKEKENENNNDNDYKESNVIHIQHVPKSNESEGRIENRHITRKDSDDESQMSESSNSYQQNGYQWGTTTGGNNPNRLGMSRV